MRTAVIGDIGGHSEELYAALVRLGADPDTLALPEDLQVVQVGDLVHRGPDSHGVLAIVAAALESGQWTQLSGNHELPHLGLEQFRWSEDFAEEDERLLRSWFEFRKLHIAAAVEGDSGEWLITHAGLTKGLYTILGEPSGAAATAQALNDLWFSREWRDILRTGCMISGALVNPFAGVVWAEAGYELAASWGEDGPPFNQVHGHCSIHRWYNRKSHAPKEIEKRLRLDEAARHVFVEWETTAIVGIDPGFGKYAGVRWLPLVLDAARVSAP